MLRIDLLNYFLEVFYVHCMFEYPHLTLFITAISHVTCLTESVSPNNMGMSGSSLVPHCLFCSVLVHDLILTDLRTLLPV